jgi:hypothetical protein
VPATPAAGALPHAPPGRERLERDLREPIRLCSMYPEMYPESCYSYSRNISVFSRLLSPSPHLSLPPFLHPSFSLALSFSSLLSLPSSFPHSPSFYSLTASPSLRVFAPPSIIPFHSLSPFSPLPLYLLPSHISLLTSHISLLLLSLNCIIDRVPSLLLSLCLPPNLSSLT